MNEVIQNPSGHKPNVIWTEARRFEDKPKGVIVVVNRSNATRPRFSYSVEFAGLDNQPRRYRSVRWSGMGTIAIDSCADAVHRVMREAEDWISGEVQRQEDELTEKRAMDRDAKLANVREPGTVRKTGKTARRERKSSA